MERQAQEHNPPTSPFYVVSQKLTQLQQRSLELKERIDKITSPTKQKLTGDQKEMRLELKQVEQKIKTLTRSIKKLTAIQEASKKVGKDHGNIWLYGVHYHW